jgi:hypothetical protein
MRATDRWGIEEGGMGLDVMEGVAAWWKRQDGREGVPSPRGSRSSDMV